MMEKGGSLSFAGVSRIPKRSAPMVVKPGLARLSGYSERGENESENGKGQAVAGSGGGSAVCAGTLKNSIVL